MNILVVGAYAFSRTGIRTVIKDDYPQAKFGEACSAYDGMRQLDADNWDLLVLDLNLPGEGGVELLSKARAITPPPAIVMLSSAPEVRHALHWLKSGSSAYLSKGAESDELIKAIKSVLSGHKYITSQFDTQWATVGEGPAQLADLSHRERQVLELIAKGLSLKEVSSALALSNKTVSTYRARLLAKLRLNTTAGLIRYALDNRL